MRRYIDEYSLGQRIRIREPTDNFGIHFQELFVQLLSDQFGHHLYRCPFLCCSFSFAWAGQNLFGQLALIYEFGVYDSPFLINTKTFKTCFYDLKKDSWL